MPRKAESRRLCIIYANKTIARNYISPKVLLLPTSNRPRSTMDSIRVSEAPDPGSIPGEATT